MRTLSTAELHLIEREIFISKKISSWLKSCMITIHKLFLLPTQFPNLSKKPQQKFLIQIFKIQNPVRLGLKFGFQRLSSQIYIKIVELDFLLEN